MSNFTASVPRQQYMTIKRIRPQKLPLNLLDMQFGSFDKRQGECGSCKWEERRPLMLDRGHMCTGCVAVATGSVST